MNLQEQFYQVMTNSRLRSSRAASSKDDARATEMINGLLVSKPAKPEVIDLQEYAKSGKAVQGVNKAKVITESLNGKHN